MVGLLGRFLLLALLFHCELGPRYNNNTDHALVFQGDADYIENPPLLSFDTILESERSFVHDSQDSTPLPSAEVLVEINSVQESVWSSFTDLKPVFQQTQERFRTYLRELLSQLGFGLGAQDHTTPSEIEKDETVVEETSFVHNGQDSTPLPSAEGLVEIDPVQKSVWPVFTDLKSAFNRTRERFRTYLRKLLSQLSFRLGAQDYTTSCETDKPAFHRTRKRFRTYLRKLLSQLSFRLGAQDYTTSCEIDEAETVVEETTVVHDSQDSTPLPSAEVRVEIDSVQESVWPGFTDLKPVFHQTQERYRTYLREILSRLGFGLGAQDHTTPCEIEKDETVVEETSFVHNGQDSTPLPSAEVQDEIDPVQESVWPCFSDLTPVFHQTQERFCTYLRELLSQLGFGLGAQDHNTPYEIEKDETVVEETSFVHNGQDSTPLPSAEVLVEIDPVQEFVWPVFTDLKSAFNRTRERFRTYLRKLSSQLSFRLGAQDYTTSCEIDEAETVVEETTFVHDSQDSTPLPSAEVLVEIDSVQESVWPSFTDLKPVFHQTQERFRTYLREILSRLGFGLGAQDHTTSCEVDQAETVVEGTSFVHNCQDSTPLPSAEVLVEIDSVQESVWPSFTDLKPVFHQTQERFRTYLRELLSQLGFGLGAQDHTTSCEIEKDETVVEETTVVHDSQDSTPLPSAEVRVEIDPVQESVWPSFTDLKPVFHQTQERYRTYLREILSRLGFGLGAQDHTTSCEIDEAETVVEETSFVHNGQDSTPLSSPEMLVEIKPVQESVWPSFTDLKSVFHQTQERFRTYLRELLSQLGFGLGAQDHTTSCEIEKDETVVEETTFVHNGQDSTPLPSAELLVEIDPVQESAWPVFTDLKSAFNRARERFRTYLRKLLSRLSFGLGAQDYTTPREMDKPAFHRTRKRLRTYLRKLIGTLWQLSSFLLEWSCLMLSIMATVEAVQICPNVFIPLFILKYASRHVEKRPVRVSKEQLEQQEDALAALDQESVEQRMALKLEMRGTQELKPQTVGPTLEQQLQDMDRRQEEEQDSIARAVEALMENNLKMIIEWDAEMTSRIRSYYTRVTEFRTNITNININQ